MENNNLKTGKDIFKEFALTNEEMINVRGGESDPIIRPSDPPIKI
jgi:hypothetical protein